MLVSKRKLRMLVVHIIYAACAIAHIAYATGGFAHAARNVSAFCETRATASHRGESERIPMKTLGLRDIIGPIMVGPSSSHTAGALRIALMARNLCGSAPQKAEFRLLGSFAHTYQGHGTDKALVAGMLGFAADDLRVRDSFRWASAKGLIFSFTPDPQADDFAHPNTIDVTVTDEAGCTVCVRGESIGGGAAVITRLDGIDVHITGEHTSVVVRQRDEAGVLAHIARCLSDEGVNIATTRMFRERRGQVAYTVLECDQRVGDKVRRAIAAHPGIFDVRVIPADSTASEGESAKGDNIDEGQALISFEALDFASGKELLSWCDIHDSTISQAFCAREEALCASQGYAADTQEYLKRALSVMRASTLRPIEEPAESMGGLLGSEAQRMRTFHASGRSVCGDLTAKAATYAMAVLETNASMGRIVAAPTAGSAGVVPGVLMALGEERGFTDEDLARGLSCAAAVGYLITRNATVSGAEGGCQAEVGAACAMAAAATCELAGGTPAQCLNAAANALTSLMGLVCDPVAGLVEVPCQKRNAAGAAVALVSAEIALAGIGNLVDFDQTVDAMFAVGKSLPFELRESALGGLAATPAACAYCESCLNRG